MADEQAMTRSIQRSATPRIGNEAVATVGAAGSVVAIVGLAGVLPQLLAEIAVILVGAAYVAAQGSAVARFQLSLSEEERRQLHRLPVGGAVTGEFVGGMAAALLGLLALLNVAQMPLLAIAVILLGAVQIASGRSLNRISALMIETSDADPRVKAVAREAAGASLGAVLLIGMGAVTLGILALVLHVATLSLVLAAGIALGLGTLFEAASRSEHVPAS
ncbi:MAG: hypothetical protein P8Y05_12725 [Deinococcales bacterium]